MHGIREVSATHTCQVQQQCHLKLPLLQPMAIGHKEKCWISTGTLRRQVIITWAGVLVD